VRVFMIGAAAELVGTVKGVVNVARDTEGIGNAVAPAVDVVFPPVAQALQNWSVRRFQRVSHHLESIERDLRIPESS
jgi:hypothetical protein